MNNYRYKVLILLYSLIFASWSYSAEWYQLYEEGRKSIDKNNCAKGVSLMQEALSKNPKSALNVKAYGTFMIEYIPHFYLFKCAVENEDWTSAQKYAKDAEAANVYSSSKSSEFTTLKKQIQSKLQPNKNQNQNPPVISNKNTTPSPPTTTPNQVENQNEIKEKLEQEKKQQELAKQTLIERSLKEANADLTAKNYAGARNSANAVLGLDSNNLEARRILREIARREEVELASKKKEDRIDEASRLVRSGNFEKAEGLLADLRAQYPSDEEVSSLWNEISKRKQDQQKQEQVKQQEQQEVEVHRSMEKKVVVSFYSGEYEKTINLAEASLESNPNSWNLHFFRGCAYAALSMLSEKNRDGNLERAREAFQKAKSVGNNSQLPPYISPKIVDVFRSS